MKRLVTAAVLASALLLASGAAADEATARFGVVPFAGGGIAGVTSPGKLPGFIGVTSLGVEALGEVMPWGGFLRSEFLSSGQDGRWTAFSVALGVSRRVLGTPETWSLLLRLAPGLEFWHGSNSGCAVSLFVPNSCTSAVEPTPPGVIVAPSQTYDVTVTTLALLAGLRVEAPLQSAYLAFDATLVPEVDLSASAPGSIWSMRFGLVFGFRDRRDMIARTAPEFRQRIHREY